MGSKGKKRQKFKQSKEERTVDRISSLPDFILVDILSHLPLHSAVATSVLSRQWRYLWTHLTHLTHLNFDSSGNNHHLNWDAYAASVNGLLPRFTSPKIHSFRLITPDGMSFYRKNINLQACGTCVESWLSSVCDRHVERIEVNIGNAADDMSLIPAPSCMFRCHSLESLSLHGMFKVDDNLVFSLPNLKQLDFELHFLDPSMLGKLLKTCPLLEQLSLQVYNCWLYFQPLDLSDLYLKRLCIKVWDSKPRSNFVINALKLESITLEGLWLAYIRFINPSPAVLVTANMTLNSGYTKKVGYHSRTIEFTEFVSSAASLHLNSNAFKAICNLNDDLVPIFDNLAQLNIDLDHFKGSWNDLLLFLRRSPNIERFTMELHSGPGLPLKWIVPDHLPPCGFSKLKRIHIQRLKGNTADYKMMSYILSNAKVLELLSVHVCVSSQRKDTVLQKERDFCEKLFQLQRPSTCEIEFSSKHLTVSSKGVDNKSPRQIMRQGQHLAV